MKKAENAIYKPDSGFQVKPTMIFFVNRDTVAECVSDIIKNSPKGSQWTITIEQVKYEDYCVLTVTDT